jgi:hypothetical protein
MQIVSVQERSKQKYINCLFNYYYLIAYFIVYFSLAPLQIALLLSRDEHDTILTFQYYQIKQKSSVLVQ